MTYFEDSLMRKSVAWKAGVEIWYREIDERAESRRIEDTCHL